MYVLWQQSRLDPQRTLRSCRLTQVGITGLTPDAEPSPRRVAEVARFAREKGVTNIFFETLVSPAVAQTVASEVGAKTAVLDPLEGRPEGGDYLSGRDCCRFR